MLDSTIKILDTLAIENMEQTKGESRRQKGEEGKKKL
jgi:hypothetical protein